MVAFSKLAKYSYFTTSRKQIVFTAAGIVAFLIFKFIKLARVHGFQVTALHFIFFFTGRSKLREKLAVADSFHVDIKTTSNRDSLNGKDADFVNLKEGKSISLGHLSKQDLETTDTSNKAIRRTNKLKEFTVHDFKNVINKQPDGVASLVDLKDELAIDDDIASFAEYVRSFAELELLGEEASNDRFFIKIRQEVDHVTNETPKKLSSEFSHEDIIDAISGTDGDEISVEELRSQLGFMFMSSLILKLKEIPEVELWEKTPHNYFARVAPTKAVLSDLEKDPQYQGPLSNMNIPTPPNTGLATSLENQSKLEGLDHDGIKWVHQKLSPKKGKILKEGVWLGSPEFFEIESDEELSWGSSASSSIPPCQMTVSFSTKQRESSIKLEKKKNRQQSRHRTQSTRRRKTARRVRYV